MFIDRGKVGSAEQDIYNDYFLSANVLYKILSASSFNIGSFAVMQLGDDGVIVGNWTSYAGGVQFHKLC